MLASKRLRTVSETVSIIASDFGPVSMSTVLAEYPASNLKTDDVNQKAIAWGQRRSHTIIEATPVEPTNEIDFVAIFGLNRKTSTVLSSSLLPNEVRLIIDTYGADVHNPKVKGSGFSASNLTEEDYVDSILNQTLNPPEIGITGGYVPFSLDAIDNAVDTVVNLTFNNNSNRPLIGTQDIYIHARDSVDITQLPQLTVVLRQSSVDIATLAVTEIERTYNTTGLSIEPIGGIYRYTFDASVLPSQTLPVQLRITGETTGTRSVDFLAVKFYSSVSGTLYDTGWQDVNTLAASGDRLSWAPRVASEDGLYIIVQFSDPGVREIESEPPTTSYTLYSMIAVLDPMEVGRFTAGVALDLPLREQGVRMQKSGNNLGNLIASRGGTLRSSRVDQMRWEVGLSIVPQSQSRVFGEIETFIQSIGAVLPAAYVMEDKDTADTDLLPAFFGVLSSYELTDIGLQQGADYDGQAPFIDKRFEISLGITDIATQVE